MRADELIEKEVMERLYAFADTLSCRDVDGLLALFAPDPDVVVLGSGTDEKRLGRLELRQQIERAWSQAEDESIVFGS